MISSSIAVPGGSLEVFEHGSGEPVVFIQTALTADELLPVATEPPLDGYRRIVFHRRGYAGSSAVEGPGSIAREVADCAAVLRALGVERSHVVGLSFSGAIALQLATDAGTFFDVDLPALLAWEFTAADAARIGCPVLYIGGTDSGPWFAEVRELLLDWFPHAEDVLMEGADHSLALTHATEIADALAAFLRRNPVSERPSEHLRTSPEGSS